MGWVDGWHRLKRGDASYVCRCVRICSSSWKGGSEHKLSMKALMNILVDVILSSTVDISMYFFCLLCTLTRTSIPGL